MLRTSEYKLLRCHLSLNNKVEEKRKKIELEPPLMQGQPLYKL